MKGPGIELRLKVCPTSMGMALVMASILAGTTSPAFGDAGVFAGNGQSLHQVTTEAVQLVSIDVQITLGRGPFLFDGSVPGMDQAQYSCAFVLRNLTDKAVEVQVGFPIDSMFARERGPVSASDSRDWVLGYDFIARDNQTTYHVDFVRRQPKPAPGAPVRKKSRICAKPIRSP